MIFKLARTDSAKMSLTEMTCLRFPSTYQQGLLQIPIEGILEAIT